MDYTQSAEYIHRSDFLWTEVIIFVCILRNSIFLLTAFPKVYFISNKSQSSDSRFRNPELLPSNSWHNASEVFLTDTTFRHFKFAQMVERIIPLFVGFCRSEHRFAASKISKEFLFPSRYRGFQPNHRFWKAVECLVINDFRQKSWMSSYSRFD